MLDDIGGYKVDITGRIEIKSEDDITAPPIIVIFIFQGKDKMTTYWLVGKDGFHFKATLDACVYIPKKRAHTAVVDAFKLKLNIGIVNAKKKAAAAAAKAEAAENGQASDVGASAVRQGAPATLTKICESEPAPVADASSGVSAEPLSSEAGAPSGDDAAAARTPAPSGETRAVGEASPAGRKSGKKGKTKNGSVKTHASDAPARREGTASANDTTSRNTAGTASASDACGASVGDARPCDAADGPRTRTSESLGIELTHNNALNYVSNELHASTEHVTSPKHVPSTEQPGHPERAVVTAHSPPLLVAPSTTERGNAADADAVPRAALTHDAITCSDDDDGGEARPTSGGARRESANSVGGRDRTTLDTRPLTLTCSFSDAQVGEARAPSTGDGAASPRKESSAKEKSVKKTKKGSVKRASRKEASKKETGAKNDGEKTPSAMELGVKRTSAEETAAKESSTKEGSTKEGSTKEASTKEDNTKETSKVKLIVQEAGGAKETIPKKTTGEPIGPKKASMKEASTKEASAKEASVKEASLTELGLTDAGWRGESARVPSQASIISCRESGNSDILCECIELRSAADVAPGGGATISCSCGECSICARAALTFNGEMAAVRLMPPPLPPPRRHRTDAVTSLSARQTRSNGEAGGLLVGKATMEKQRQELLNGNGRWLFTDTSKQQPS
ncbi:PREDICTED: protein starmaker-like [Priapulus caudatus]|uniref:Protein starmaker-like n=1 Tax=Priapulus caudatus TaxID=37621 RepID=A0ABM1EN38_PRICU|nr:PREDICTED: protein starmaker-like [Priapulus caudatus]